jgi:outer membrane lipoprotein-sorting protein
MKKLFLAATFLLAATALNAQGLDEIISKYTAANKLDKMGNIKTIKIAAKTSVMGMDMPIEMWMKSPNKFKTVTSFSGQEMIQVFDGEKGYMVNPMTGSMSPVELTPDQVKQIDRNNYFNNYMAQYLKEGKLVLEGEESVKGKQAYKIKADLGNGTNAYMFIDKASSLLVKTIATVNQQGMDVTVESYPSDYTETNGVFLPMKTTTSTSGMEIVTTFTKVEVDVPIDDSVFKLK